MNTTAIIVILVGIVIFVVSFLIPAGNEEGEDDGYTITQEEVRKAVSAEAERGRIRLEEVVDETVTYAIEKAERAMERVSNEKIMAIGEYSDTVLKDIDKTHKEVTFLYDMLNDKHDNLQETVKVAQQATTDAKMASEDARLASEDARLASEDIRNASEDAGRAQDSDGGYADFVNPDVVRRLEAEARSAQEETEAADKAMTADDLLSAIDEVAVEERPAKEFKAFEPPKVEVVPKKKAATKSSRTGTKKKTVKTETETPEKIPQLQFSTGDEESDNLGKANNNERILEMHRAGKSNMAIAKALGLGMGEVKLVIDLYEKGIKG